MSFRAVRNDGLSVGIPLRALISLVPTFGSLNHAARLATVLGPAAKGNPQVALA